MRWNRDGTADDSRSGQLDGIVSGDRDLLRDGFRALDRDDAMRGVPRTQLDRSDLLASGAVRSEEHTSELQSLMRISYAVFCLNKKKQLLEQTNSNVYLH